MIKNNKNYNKPEDAWKIVSISKGLNWCKIHEVTFKSNSKCPECYPLDTPMFHMEKGKKKCRDIKKGVDGVDGLTNREFEALKYYNQTDPKLTLSDVADRMGGITKQRVSVLVNNALRKLGLSKKGVDSKGVPLTKGKGGVVSPLKRRLKLNWHAEEITVDIEPIDFIAVKLVKWSNTEYWCDDTSEHHIKLFKNKIKITFKRSIEGFERDRISLEANRRCISFLKNINRFLNRRKLKGKIVLKDKGRFLRVKRHWAIIGSGLAKKLRDEKRDLYVYDRDTGELSLCFDMSEMEGHIESHNVKKGDSIIDKTKQVFDEYIHDEVYTPKETTEKIDVAVNLVHNLAESSQVFAERSDMYAENIKLHLDVMRDIKDTLKEIRKEIKNNKGV